MKNKFKPSYYNHFAADDKNDKYFLFNAHSQAKVQLNSEQYTYLHSLLEERSTPLDNADDELIKDLSYGGFIVPEDHSEKSDIKS